MGTDSQDLINKTKQAEQKFWDETHAKQRCHDLAKEAEEGMRRNQKQEQKKGGK